jgi:DNA repair protein RadC
VSGGCPHFGRPAGHRTRNVALFHRAALAWALLGRTQMVTARAPQSSFETVGNHELVALLIAKSDASAVAASVVDQSGGLGPLSRATPRELSKLRGLGRTNALRIAAAFELGRRAFTIDHARKTIARPEDVFDLVQARVVNLAQELFFVLGVDIRNGALDLAEVARGSVHGVEVHPREIFRPLIRMAAAGGVLIHNHPTGDPTPSEPDIELTRRLRTVGDVIGIPIIDHVVIGANMFRSVVEFVGTAL